MKKAQQAPIELACLVPVYNEAAILPKAIPMLVKALRKFSSDFVVVIANNGSTDATSAVAERLVRKHAPFVRHAYTTEKGRGQAFRYALRTVKAAQYIYIDADLPCELGDLERHILALREGADLVLSRRVGARPLKRRGMTGGLRLLNRLFFNLKASDSQCAIKGLSPRAAKVMSEQCKQNGWFLDTELAVLASHQRLKIEEVPIHWIEERFAGRESKVDILADSWRCFLSLVQIKRAVRELDRSAQA